MNKYILSVVFISIFLYSCGIKVMLLGNGKTKVPLSKEAYKNRIYFDSSLLRIFDTSAVYQEINASSNWIGYYRFYSNGNLNLFVLKDINIQDEKLLDPQYDGYRGIYYRDKNKMMADLFAEVSQTGKIGKLRKELIVSKDTLYITTYNGALTYRNVYVRRMLPFRLKHFPTNW